MSNAAAIPTAFPDNFQTDTRYLRAALAEFQEEHQPRANRFYEIERTLDFGELNSSDRAKVLARAQELKLADARRRVM